MPELLNSLECINYPKGSYEIIVIDDSSSDGTYELIKKNFKNKQNLSLYKAENKIYPAKKGALQAGIQKARFPFVVITDADCIVSPEWLNVLADSFSSGNDFVIGHAPFLQSGNRVNTLSCFENLRSSILIFALAGLHLPYSAVARNLAFRKDAYKKIRGYENTMDVPSGDDDLLIREAVKGKMKIGTVLLKESFVYSRTKDTFRDYLRQKGRHTSTSNYYLFRHKLILGAWHIMNITFLLSILLAFLIPAIILLPLFKITSDMLTIIYFQKKFGYKFSISEIILHQVIYEMMLIINYINGLSPEANRWK